MNFELFLHYRPWLMAAEVTLIWSFVTIGLYLLSKRFHRRYKKWWTTPIIITPILLIVITLLSHTNYNVYIRGTHWLMALLGPATVAFAIPIYRRRNIIVLYWKTLSIGVVFGSILSIASAWFLASAVGIDDAIRLSLLPRSISTPFAMVISGEIGGVPELTALFVILTGIFGASFGQLALYWLPLKSKLSMGASFGLAAHVAGSSKAYELDNEVGTIAALVMVLTGLFNVLIAPLLEAVLS
ncbi:LrgB family protein [Sulfurospirillum sp. hDNRA2]|uniref:LrgB family protein n=1 Tax=Sulfurospirillum sp. hDNRA2 TaxID=3237298 RepID=UPI0020B6AA90|nr:LrgB family protein [Sulfurospirillum sp. DNRA8]MCP3651826.1 LrgB family protein [Sulfurospirillum sp. DNRA8]MCR1810673.1 LrgB family protein [Sulfurospirillum sp. DNRA8]